MDQLATPLSPEEKFAALRAYTHGELTRSQVMSALNIDWYGDLLVAMNEAGLRIVLPAPVLERMANTAAELFAKARKDKPSKD